ncbi:DNA (cytosine-5)-methyltransferase 3B [Eufriesea mexicana]|uniref:DNA (cytosine-5-)-methyltransferase n=1 Tax=Eufriesea mexicana TaxID=516756 RepID=A0A310SMK0_9HYME|nr:DNA (cytosine-5)-methyltransferase 3B [Eufriesea mexicana]
MDPLQLWAEKSVWSMVCAMELGLISDTASNERSRADTDTEISTSRSIDVGRCSPRNDQASSESSARTHAYFSNDSLSKRVNGDGRRKRASKFAYKFASRTRRTRRNVFANRKDDVVTVDKFWRSRKSKFGASGKWANRDIKNTDRSKVDQQQRRFSYRTRSTALSSPIDNPVSPVTKRKRIDRNDGSRRDPSREENASRENHASHLYPAKMANDGPTNVDAITIEIDQLDAFESSWPINEGREETRAVVRTECDGNERRSWREDDNALIENRTKFDRASREPLENELYAAEDAARSVKFDEIHTLPLAERISNEGKSWNENERNDSHAKGSEMPRNENAATITAEPVMKKFVKSEGLGAKTCKGNEEYQELNEKTQIEPFSCNLESRLTHNLNIARIHAIDATMQILRKTLGCALTKPYFSWIQNNYSNAIETLDEVKFYPYPIKIQQRLEHLREKNAKVTEKYVLDQKRESQGKKWTEKPKDPAQRSNVDPTRLPLKEQNAGIIAWAKIAGHNWWPAMIIDYRDCCMREPSFGCQWIMWYGDYKLSEVHHRLFLKFDKGMEKMRDYINNTKKHIYLVGVLQASKDYCFRLGFETENWTLDDALRYFSKAKQRSSTLHDDPSRRADSVKIYDKYSARIVTKLYELKNNPNVDDERTDEISKSDDLRSAMNGDIAFESLCLKCLKVPEDSRRTEIHPFFEGSLCEDCSGRYKPCMFVFGNDAKCFYCTVCAASGMMIICDKEDCPRVYCTACMKHLLCRTTYEQVLQEDPWECFLCASKSRSFPDMIVRPRANWKDKIINMFRTNCNSNVQQLVERNREKRKIRVLSLFDGLATGLLVLLKLGLAVDAYYASEIDPDALMVSASHFGDRIIRLGNVKDITEKMIGEMAPIDLLIGGSPCNDLSLANPMRLGLHDPNGTGILFFEYRRILELVKKKNNKRRLFWLYENVASMPSEYRLEINKHLGQEPDVIDSADFSPQHRLRLYWHNLPIEPQSLPFQGEQDVQDILTPHCQRYSLVKKIRTVTTKVNSLKQGKLALKPILMKDESDSLWITELEEIFGFPRHYTDVKNLSATKRQRLIGKSWSVQTLSAILRSLCPFFECNTNEIN